ncbi:6224_t:CDS:2, partial [Gigaspora rosea]
IFHKFDFLKQGRILEQIMDDIEILDVSTSDTESSDSSSVSDKVLDVTYDLETQPEISPLNSVQFQTKLVFSTEKQNSFLLKNHINLSDDNLERVKKFSDVITNSTNGPLTDKLPANDIYIEIQCTKFCLAIPKRIIKPTEKLIEDANKALQHHDPYHKIIDLFQIYKEYISSHNFDSSYFASINGDLIMRNNLEEWIEYCLDNDSDLLQIVSWNELYPLYEIFDSPLRQEIESGIGVGDQSIIKERVLMAGAILISDPPFSYRVNFPIRFKSNNYQLFGKLIDQNEKPFNDIVIKFKSNDIDGELIFMDAIIAWILVRIPANIGFFSTDTRRIDVVRLSNTSLTVTSKSDNYCILLKVPENVPQSSILVTSFKCSLSNYDLNFKIEAQNNTTNEIKITVCKLGSDKVDCIYELECSIQWCILVIPENTKFYNSSISTNYLKAIGEYIYPEYNIMAPFDESELNASQKFQSDFQVGKFKDKSKSLNFYPSDLKREIKTKNNK